MGGLKVVAANGWFAARPSGTENIYKIYAESFKDRSHLESILGEAQSMVNDGRRCVHRIAPCHSPRRNLKQDLEDVGSNFDGAPDLEFRSATGALELQESGLSYQRVPPGYRFPYGRARDEQEEVYVVVPRERADEGRRRDPRPGGMGRGARPAGSVARL